MAHSLKAAQVFYLCMQIQPFPVKTIQIFCPFLLKDVLRCYFYKLSTWFWNFKLCYNKAYDVFPENYIYMHFTEESMFCIVDYPTMDLPQWTVEMDHTAGTVLWIIFALHLQMVSPCLEFTQRKIFNMFKKKYLRHGYSVSLKFTQWWLPFLESPKQSII